MAELWPFELSNVGLSTLTLYVRIKNYIIQGIKNYIIQIKRRGRVSQKMLFIYMVEGGGWLDKDDDKYECE